MMMTKPEAKEKKAIVYTRVSSISQEDKGDGRGSQEHRCRQYADAKGYTVEEVFSDVKSAAGDFMQRPGMVSLLEYLREHKATDYIVIFDDLKRFARDTEFHIRLRSRLAKYGARPECLNFKFEDTPEGKFVETVIAAQGELERVQNQRQTVQKMKARVERGFHPFFVPIGYKFAKCAERGKIVVRDEPFAGIIQDALERFACGQLATQAEVKRHLESVPGFPKNAKGEVRAQKVHDILTDALYAGMVEAPFWGVTRRKGQHEALISYETFLKIQERLKGNGYAPARKDLDADFPLRGAVFCADCGAPLTASWSKGRHGNRYPYYLCFKRACASYGKSVKRDALESEFRTFLCKLEPTAGAIRVTRARFEDLWNHRLASGEAMRRTLKTEIDAIEKSVGQLLDRILETDTPLVARAMEKRIQKLEEEKAVKLEKIEKCGRPVRSFDASVRTALHLIASLCKVWDSGSLAHRRAVLRLAVPGGLHYSRNEGLRTPDFASPFKLLRGNFGEESRMAEREGFEPYVIHRWCRECFE